MRIALFLPSSHRVSAGAFPWSESKPDHRSVPQMAVVCRHEVSATYTLVEAHKHLQTTLPDWLSGIFDPARQAHEAVVALRWDHRRMVESNMQNMQLEMAIRSQKAHAAGGWGQSI